MSPPVLTRLAVDVGNSGLKAACFIDGELQLPITRLAADDWEGVARMATNLGVVDIIYSTVANVPPQPWIDKWTTGGRRRIFALDRNRPLPFASDYRSLDTLGQDRIAALAGTLDRFTTARLVVDAGSCVTADLMDASDRHLGGNISPGIRMRLRAMHTFTARLPLPQLTPPEENVGLSTKEALLHGGIRGTVYEIEGLYRRLLPTHPDLQLLLTGGDASLLLPHFTETVHCYPHLVLCGLHQILSNYVNEPY